MERFILAIFILLNLFIFINNSEEAYLSINKSKKHEDQTKDLTPLVVTLSSDDKDEGVRGVDLICLIDYSGSMRRDKITLVRNSLLELVNLMNKNDKLALIKFDSYAHIILQLSFMNDDNKNIAKQKIKDLTNPSGGTNIYEGLKQGLQLLTENYSDGNRVASIILLSDGDDLYRSKADLVGNFTKLISDTKKEYIFTLHTFGYGKYHDSELMDKLSKVRDGGYYNIRELPMVKEALSKIYGLLSTTFKVNVQIEINSQYPIKKIYGMEDFYNGVPSKIEESINKFSTTIIHFKHGKKYHFVLLLDIPSKIGEGTKILEVSIPSLNKEEIYIWKSNEFHPFAYEEYIRGISIDYFQKSYNSGENGIGIIQSGINWINYEGIDEKWKDIYNDILKDLGNFDDYGKANLLSKLRELKTEKPGMHFKDLNSYEEKIINNLHSIEKTKYLTPQKIIGKGKTMKFSFSNGNYSYFYLKEGVGKINDLIFSGEHSTIVLSSPQKTDEIIIECLSESLEFYYYSENTKRTQTEVDFSKGGKFSFKNEFPLQFYTLIDGNKDVTFNIQFTKLDGSSSSSMEGHSFEIIAYIFDNYAINDFFDKIDNIEYCPGKPLFNGYYDKGLRFGQLVINKEDILGHLTTSAQNYLYVVIKKPSNADNNYVYNKVEGQFSFITMDSYSDIPENFYISSNLSPNKKAPHLYKLQMEKELGKQMRIEFASSGNELYCSILSKKFDSFSKELYEDSVKVERKEGMGKTYIYITQSDKEENKFSNVMLSIYSKNGDHITGKDITKLSYIIRYTTSSNYGIYEFNDIEGKNGEVNNERDGDDLTVTFKRLQNIIGGKQSNENSRFFFKLYNLNRRIKLYNTISLFKDKYTTYNEIVLNNDVGQFKTKINSDQNYYFTILAVSEVNNEFISYNNTLNKINSSLEEIEIDDYNSYENEFYGELNLEISISDIDGIEKKYLEIKITDFDEGQYGFLEVETNNQKYQSMQHSDHNIVVIPKERCGETVHVLVKFKEGLKQSDYFFSIQFVDQIEVSVGQNLFLKMFDEFEGKVDIIINYNSKTKDNINVFVQSTDGNLDVSGYHLSFAKSEIFGAKSTNFIGDGQNAIQPVKISAKNGENISLFTHIINNSKKKMPRDYDINLYGYLNERECIYFNDDLKGIDKYQIRILGDKNISILYNEDINYEYTEPGILYIKEYKERIDKLCLRQANELESVFFNIQILDVSKQIDSTVNMQPILFDVIYTDELSLNEIRFYRQGLFDPNKDNSELKYTFNVHQSEGSIKVYTTKCKDYPNCKFNKENIEADKNAISLYNINEIFTYSKKASDIVLDDPETIPVYVILCQNGPCKYKFVLSKSSSIINLSNLGKFTSKINKNQIDKYLISQKDGIEKMTITLYTHTGEVMLRTNDKCENIKHTIFGHMERMEIPKEEIDHSFEIFVQASMDSVYSIEYTDTKDLKIKSNIINIVNVNKEETIEFTPANDIYFIKFIPINCDISIKYGGDKNLQSQNKIYYYFSKIGSDKYNKFTVSTKDNDCMIYTYLEELTDDLYGILSDKVPYYLSLNGFKKNYKLIYPLANSNYEPMYRLNFFEETPIKLVNKINKKQEDEINAIMMKDITPSSSLLKECNEEGICYLIIEINYDKSPDTPIILEIIPKSTNNIPGVLRNNQMRQDFSKIKEDQKYMAKILHNEEGEVSFNYKFFSGELVGRLMSIDKKSWKNRYDLPEKNEQLKYDNLKQKIFFTKKETSSCINGCYLFIEVNSLETFKETNDKDKDYSEGINMDYSLCLKKYDNIVQVRLNEVVYGSLTKTINDNYIEYYSIEIPYSTKKIFIDFSSENAKVIIKKGKERPTIKDNNYDYQFEKDQIYTIESNSNENFKEQIFVIGVYTNKLENKISQYNIRIRAENELLKNYIYSDINTENICKLKDDNQSCLYLIPIINVQKNANLFLYGISSKNSEDLIISYKKVTNLNDDGQFTRTSEGQFIKNMLIINNAELNLNENENIVIKIDSKEAATITLLYTFKSHLYESLINPKHKVVYEMNPNESLFLDIPDGLKSLVQINAIDGKGFIGYEDDKNNVIELSGKYSSTCLQSDENDEDKRIKITTDSSPFYFYTTIKINSNKRNINDISKGSSSLKTIKGFPIEFYSKISDNKDYTINFNINNIKEISNENVNLCDFILKAYIVQEETIEKLNTDDTYVYIGIPFKGKYESGFGTSILDLSKEDIKKYYQENKNNYIYIKVEASSNNPSILNQINGEISILENNNLEFVTPDNIYINGNLKSAENYKNQYKLVKKNKEDKIIRIEFSSSSEYVKYKISPEEIKYEETNNLGKKNIDINVENINDSIILDIYSDEKIEDKNLLSYSFRYRTDEGKKTFKNYGTYGDSNGKIKSNKIEEKPELNKRQVEITIPSIKESQSLRSLLNSEEFSPNYYLKVYTLPSKNKLKLSNTISIIEGIELFKSYEFQFNEDTCTKNIDIPYDKDVYISVKATTPDKELLSYESLFIETKGNKDNDEGKNNYNDYDNDIFKMDAKFFIIIALLIIIIFILVFLIARSCCLKKRENQIEKMIDNTLKNQEMLLNEEDLNSIKSQN